MVEKISWNDSYLLGITEIDNQHKKLVALADKLYACLSEPKELLAKHLPEILKELADYTVYHFDHEFEFMTKEGYPGHDIHKTAHDSFVLKVKESIANLDSANVESVENLYSFLTNWILKHIAKADSVWAKFVLSKNK